MKKHVNLWLVMFLAFSLALPIYSMAQTTLTLESYTTGDRIKGAPIKSFSLGTDGNLVVYLDGPFTFSTLDPNISVDGTSGTYSGCTVSPPASVTATPGANLSFRVFSTTANANLSMVVDPDPGVTTVNGAVPGSYPTPPSLSPLTIVWRTAGIPAGSYLAVFQAQVETQTPSQLVVMIKISQQYKLTLTAGANGTVSPAGDSYYDPGTSVQISATANSGYYFSSWSDGGTGNQRTVVMNQDRNITATFTQTPRYTLTTSVSPTGGGTVTGAGTYDSGVGVTVTATAAQSYTFSSWSGDLSGSTTPTTITMNSNKSVTATFTQSSTPPPTGNYPKLNNIAAGSGDFYGATISIGESEVKKYILPLGEVYPGKNLRYLKVLTAATLDGRGQISMMLYSPDIPPWSQGGLSSTADATIYVAARSWPQGPNYPADYLNNGNWILEITGIQTSTLKIWWKCY